MTVSTSPLPVLPVPLQPLARMTLAHDSENREARFAEDWDYTVEELTRIRTFQNGWDGEGSEAPEPALIDAAVRLCDLLRSYGIPAPGRVNASVNATIRCEWVTEAGYTELEIVSSYGAECRWIEKGSNTAQEVEIAIPRPTGME